MVLGFSRNASNIPFASESKNPKFHKVRCSDLPLMALHLTPLPVPPLSPKPVLILQAHHALHPTQWSSFKAVCTWRAAVP